MMIVFIYLTETAKVVMIRFNDVCSEMIDRIILEL
jgi:hypothetical protein